MIGYANNTSFPSTLGTVATSFLSSASPIISPVTKIYMTCSWVNNTTFSKYNTVIASYTPDKPYLSLLSYSPLILLKYPVVQQTYSTIAIKFTDQNFNDLAMIDKNQVDVTLNLFTNLAVLP